MLNSIKKDIEMIKRDQSQMNNTIWKMKNALEGMYSRLDEAEDWISNLEDKVG